MYAKLHRTAIRVALGLAALGGVSVASAGYAWPADPAGFSRSGPWGAGPGYAAGANDSRFGRVIHQQNGLKVQVSGRAVTMPVSYRLAQNAPRFAAQALFLHPGVRTAAGIASWLVAGKLIWDEAEKVWKKNADSSQQSNGYEYSVSNLPGQWFSSAVRACAAGQPVRTAQYNAANAPAVRIELNNDESACYGRIEKHGENYGQDNLGLSKRVSSCPSGWYSTPAGCTQTPQRQVVGEEEFMDILSPKPMPETVPLELPPNTPLPVEPNPKINPEPGQNPQHRPIFVPTGDPVPNPNYDPNASPGPNNRPWIQPGVRLNPSPTVNDPWRIDVQPVDRPKEDANPLPGPESETNPDTGKDDKPRPEERPGLCDEYPDILACQKPELDTPDDEIPKTTKDVSYTPDNLFGGGSCPANKTMNIAGQQMTVWDWDASCGYIQNYMRPVILVLCAFAAFVIVSGGTRQ